MVCPRCGNGTGPGARFCEACGAPVREVAPGASAGSDPGSRARVYAALPALRGAHLFALRAATDLARLRAAQGQVLAPVYASFTEGFDAKDLKEAKAVLDELETSG